MFVKHFNIYLLNLEISQNLVVPKDEYQIPLIWIPNKPVSNRSKIGIKSSNMITIMHRVGN